MRGKAGESQPLSLPYPSGHTSLERQANSLLSPPGLRGKITTPGNLDAGKLCFKDDIRNTGRGILVNADFLLSSFLQSSEPAEGYGVKGDV
jgi:hypothetical protein